MTESLKFSQLPITNEVTNTAFIPLVDLSQPAGFQNQIIPLSMIVQTPQSNVTLNGIEVQTFDPNYFAIVGTNTVSLKNISNVFTPTITIADLPTLTLGDDLLANGTLTGYGFSPNLLLSLVSGGTVTFIGGIGVLPFFGTYGTSSVDTFTIDLPAGQYNGVVSSAGTYGIEVTDWLGTVSNISNFVAQWAQPTTAFITGCATPLSYTSTQVFDNGSNGFSPNSFGYVAWTTVNNGSADIYPRVMVVSGSFPTLTIPGPGTYTIKIYSAETGGTLLATSNTITVTS